MRNIISLFISFFSILTFLNSPTTKKYSVGVFKVALVFDLTDNNYDCHWYRQDSDGFWSHKLGVNSVSRLDSNFNIIVDPSLSAHEYSSHTYGNNSYGVTFFAIKPYGLREAF